MKSVIESELFKAARVVALASPITSTVGVRPYEELPSIPRRGRVYHVYYKSNDLAPRFSIYGGPVLDRGAIGTVLHRGGRFASDGNDDDHGDDMWPLTGEGGLDRTIWPYGGDNAEIDLPEYDGHVVHDAVASYYNMESPGRIEIYMDKVFHEFWLDIEYLWRALGFRPGRSDVTDLAGLFLFSIWQHELFHHFCDVLTYLAGHPDHKWRERAKEEPLAVAYSRKMSGEAYSASPLVTAYLERRYDFRTLKYYSDWEDYFTTTELMRGMADYLSPGRATDLARLGYSPGAHLLSSVKLVADQENYSVILWWPRP